MKIGDVAAGPGGVGEVVGIENGVSVSILRFNEPGQKLTRTVAALPADKATLVRLKEERSAGLDLDD